MKVLVWEARDKRNLSIRELAEKTGIKKSTLHNIETGKKSPTLDELDKIAKALNCKVTGLFNEYK